MNGTQAGRKLRYLRCTTANRYGREACSQPMVRNELLEGQLAAYVSGMRLPADALGQIVTELRRQSHPVSGGVDDAGRLRREIDRWQRLFAIGEIDEPDYRQRVRPLRQQLGDVERPGEVLDVERAMAHLKDVGRLWAGSSRVSQQAFVRKVFSGLVIEGPQLPSPAGEVYAAVRARPS